LPKIDDIGEAQNLCSSIRHLLIILQSLLSTKAALVSSAGQQFDQQKQQRTRILATPSFVYCFTTNFVSFSFF